MRFETFSASALLLATFAEAGHGVHENLELIHRQHREKRVQSLPETATGIAQEEPLEKRGGQCQFPYGVGLVAVTPGSQNAGWAMSPNQPCLPGNYCPYACPPGQVSMQWDPTATSYSYPKSMNGGLYCDNNGNIQKPFPNKPYCQSTATNIGVQNNCGGNVAFCQTVLPGNEAMLIPTLVQNYATLAVPDTSYWAGTAAHYYINAPGTGTDEACVWGSSSSALGNWAPYVAGANQDGSGNTFIKLGWNPIYLEPATPFRNNMPNWGVKIDCPNGGCNGLPCAIDPTQNSVNQMIGSASNGAGGGAFCVVTVAKGSTANFIVYQSGGDSSSHNNAAAKAGQFYQSSSSTTTTTTAATTTTANSTTTTTTTTSSSTTTWAAWNQTVSSTVPYYSYNATTMAMPSTAQLTPTGPTMSGPSIIPSTGAASKLDVGLGFILAALLLI